MPLWLVEVRRTVEWGGYFEAETEAEARQAAALEMGPVGETVDEQILCKIVETENQIQ